MTDQDKTPAPQAPPGDADDWADALAEQTRGSAATQAEGLKSTSDEWADAMAEQSAAAPVAAVAATSAPVPAPASASTSASTSAPASAPASTSTSAPASGSAPTSASAVSPPPAPASLAAQPAGASVFQPLATTAAGAGSDIDMIMDVPVQLTVELGRTRLTIKNLLQLGQGSVVELDGLAGEPMDIFVNGYLIAQGEVVVVEDRYGIRLTDIITPSERINRLSGRR